MSIDQNKELMRRFMEASVESDPAAYAGLIHPDMVAFFARKGSTWYYIEAGVFATSAP